MTSIELIGFLGVAALLLQEPGVAASFALAIFVSSLVGGILYSVAAFWKIGAERQERSWTEEEAVPARGSRRLVAGFFLNFLAVLVPNIVAAFVILILLGIIDYAMRGVFTFPTGASGGFTVGLLLWFVSLPTIVASSTLRRKRVVHAGLDAGYSLATCLLMSTILGAAIL